MTCSSFVLLGMTDNLCVHVLWDLAREAHGDFDYLPGLEPGQIAQDLVGAAK